MLYNFYTKLIKFYENHTYSSLLIIALTLVIVECIINGSFYLSKL